VVWSEEALLKAERRASEEYLELFSALYDDTKNAVQGIETVTNS
jgi:hypothetical protein